jgi:hypothetical protein
MALPTQSLTEYHHCGDFVIFASMHSYVCCCMIHQSEFISPVAVSNSQIAVKFYSSVQAVRKVQS